MSNIRGNVSILGLIRLKHFLYVILKHFLQD